MKETPNCKNFSGYKPCYSDHDCWINGCKNENKIGTKILIINLDAMGDVLMTTAQLKEIKNKYPQSTIHWITLKIAAPLLDNNPFLDKVWTYNFESILVLDQMQFDIIMNVDKSQRSGALAERFSSNKKLGFGVNNDGKIYPFNEGANYNYLLGMDDELKFKKNKVTGEEYLAETFELQYTGSDYVFNFSDSENKFIKEYRLTNDLTDEDLIIGFNTGCSTLFPNKKMTVNQHVQLIKNFLGYKKFKILLLGGPEDEERNREIASNFNGEIINTPTNLGVRKGACFESIPQLIITGDSFGMHLAIALKKYVIAWFGLSCWTEIEMFNRGIKLYPENLECSPCWKKKCPHNLECREQIDLKKIELETIKYFSLNHKLSIK